MVPRAIRSTASACVPGAGPACIATKSVLVIIMDRTALRSAVAKTVEAVIISLVNAIAPPVTLDRCEFQISL